MGARLIPAEALTREQRRSRRKRDVRAVTIDVSRLTKRELRLGALLYPDEGDVRPRTRGDCVGGPRPCPFVACKFHLFLDASPSNGAIKLNFPDLEPEELSHSCCLDVADAGAHTLEDTAEILNLTRERIRQIEVRAYQRIRESGVEVPHPDEFEHHVEALPDAGPSKAIEDVESVPGKLAHNPATEAAKHAERATILRAENAARSPRA